MEKKEIKKVVLAYSGGLDTSIIIPWLKENYNNCEVIAVSGNVGQADELDGLEEKAIATGASKLYVEDLTDEFVDEYVVLDGHELSVDDTLCEELVLSFPQRLLCSEDCEGLCPKCGKPRREGDCGCPTKEIDPRFAVLATFFDDSDEEDKK